MAKFTSPKSPITECTGVFHRPARHKGNDDPPAPIQAMALRRRKRPLHVERSDQPSYNRSNTCGDNSYYFLLNQDANFRTLQDPYSGHPSVNLVSIVPYPTFILYPLPELIAWSPWPLTHQLNRCNRSNHESCHVHLIVRYITTLLLYYVLSYCMFRPLARNKSYKDYFSGFLHVRYHPTHWWISPPPIRPLHSPSV